MSTFERHPDTNAILAKCTKRVEHYAAVAHKEGIPLIKSNKTDLIVHQGSIEVYEVRKLRGKHPTIKVGVYNSKTAPAVRFTIAPFLTMYPTDVVAHLEWKRIPGVKDGSFVCTDAEVVYEKFARYAHMASKHI